MRSNRTLPLVVSLAVLAGLPLLSGCVEGKLDPINELLEVGPELPEGVSAGPDGSIAIGKGLAVPEGFALGEEDWKALAFMEGFDCYWIWYCYSKCPWGSLCVCEWDGQRWQCIIVPSEDFCEWFKHGCGEGGGGGDWTNALLGARQTDQGPMFANIWEYRPHPGPWRKPVITVPHGGTDGCPHI